MRKAECLKMQKISPTAKIIKLAKTTTSEKNYYGNPYKGLYNYYLRAVKTNDLIKVSVFEAEWIKAGIKESHYDIFIDTEGCRYITLEKNKDGSIHCWRTAMISNLIGWVTYYGRDYKHISWSNEDTDRKLRSALSQSGTAFRAIDRYQRDILAERIKKKEQKECAVWDKDMKPIKALPKNFPDWIRRNAIKDHFIFYKYSKNITKGFCSCCNSEVDISGMSPKNARQDVCPKCRSRITFKSIGKIKTLCSRTAYAQIIQPYPGGHVIRYVSANMYYKKSEYWAPIIRVNEYRRSIHGDSTKSDYAWENYKNKYTRWLPVPSRWYYDDAAVLYPRGISNLPYAGHLKAIQKEHLEVSISQWSEKMVRDSIYEKLANAGFYKLLTQFMNRYGWDPEDLTTKDRELHKALKLDKMRLKRLKKMGGGTRELEWLQAEKEADRIWPDEMIRYFSDAGYNTRTFYFISDRMTYPQIFEYLKKQYSLHGYTWDYTYTCWRDYMDMAEKLKIPLDLERNYKPKDVRIAHNEARDMLQGKDIEAEARKIDRKWKKLKKIYPTLAKYEYTGKDYQIIAPKSTGDIVREGMILKHCVHSCDFYFDRISTNESYILFLRKTADPKQPYYTLEVEPSGNIRQKRTTGDRQNEDFKDAKKFLTKWQRAIQKKLSKEDKALGKKSNDLRLKELKELRKNGNRVWHGVLQGKLLADVLEADFMPVMQEAQ